MADEARTYEPTPRRLRLARERGEVARSPLLSAAVVLTAVCAVLAATGGAFVDAWLEAVRATWTDPAPADAPERFALLGVRALALPLGVAVLAAAVTGLAQVGPLWAGRALRFDPARLDPVQGLRRLFDGATLAARLTPILVGLALLGLGGWVMRDALLGALGRTDLSPREVLEGVGATAGALAWRGCALMLLAGAAALAFHRWRHRRSLRMSRRELREEARQTQGDPEAKRRRARRRRALALTPSVADAAASAALVVHGDGVTVAIAWDGGDGSPAVALAARGVGARELRIATRAVPALRDAALAAELGRLEPSAPVPRRHWRALAGALARAGA